MLADWIRHAFSQGWVCIRTHARGSGHEAHDAHVRDPYRPTLEECLAWAERGGHDGEGGNVEVLLHESGLLQVDAEAGAPAPWGDPAAHPGACLASSAGGGLHAVYAWGGVRQRWIKPTPGVDLLSKGVWPLPGCRRLGDERKPAGAWVALEPPRAPVAAPQWVSDAVPRPPARPAVATAAVYTGDGYGMAALASECARIAAAPEGRRNATLCRGSYRIGQLAGAKLVDGEAALEQLVAAGEQAGLPEKEARSTAFRAMEAGRGNPRGPAPPALDGLVLVEDEALVTPAPGAADPEVETLDGPAPTAPLILAPGSHKLPTGEHLEVSNDAFAGAALGLLPSLYRRDTVAGEVVAGRFLGVDEDDLRRLCGPPRMRVGSWCKVKQGKEQVRQALLTEPCTAALARLVRSRAARDAREIKLLTTYPVVLPTGGVSPPGYHAASGTYYAGRPVEPLLDAAAIRAHLDDLVADYPFEDQASRANFFGLLLTPMLRPTLGKVPLHLVTSPQAGTGKSRLIEDTLGCTYLGKPLPSSALPERGEERAKWLTALLLSGTTLLHLDNLTPELDSGNLASLLTSAAQTGRVLGTSSFPQFDNVLTLAASGNNTVLSSELARRTVVVRLIWRGPGRPDDRSEFAHPDSCAYAVAHRERTLACLAGLVQLWDGREVEQRLGSFERWSAVVGGILECAGIEGHLANRARWRDETDAQMGAAAALVYAWFDRFGSVEVTAQALQAALQDELEAAGAKRDSAVSAGIAVARLKDRAFEGAGIVRVGWTRKKARVFWIEPLGGGGAPADQPASAAVAAGGSPTSGITSGKTSCEISLEL